MTKFVACNNEIKEVHYSGFTISKIYACGGQLVYSKDPEPTRCIGTTLPNDFVLNYNAKGYNPTTHTMEKYSGQTNGINCVLSGDVENIVVYPDHLDFSNTSGVIANITGNANFDRGNTNHDFLTIIAKAYKPSSSSNSFIISNKGNWSFRWRQNDVLVYGDKTYNCLGVPNNQPSIIRVVTEGNYSGCVSVDCSSVVFVNQNTHDWCPNSGTPATWEDFKYGSTNNNIARLFGRDGSNEHFDGNFYWIFMAKRQLTAEEVKQVIEYNEYCYGINRIAQWNKADVSDYACSGTTKMYKEYYQYSDDGGQTWENVIPESSRTSSDVIEYNSTDCGYVPMKYKLEYKNDIPSYSALCNSSTTLTSGEVNVNNYRTSVSSATIGDCVEVIGNRAFQECLNMINCTMGSGVTSIEEYAFYDCYVLRNVVIPSGMTSIGDYTFVYCRNLSSINLPSELLTIGSSAFEYCTGLTSVVIPNKVTTIGAAAFQFCSGATSLSIGTSVTTIGDSAFRGCSGLSYVNDALVIPNSVQTIGGAAFQYCRSIQKMDIGTGITSIGNSFLNGCPYFQSLTIRALTPPTIYDNTLSINSGYDWKIYVPSSRVTAYKNAPIWNLYASKIQAIPS